MIDRKEIAAYYLDAREFVQQNKPQEARDCILDILNCVVEMYNNATTILEKARMTAFLDEWIAVPHELYENGITDFVLKRFGLPARQEEPHLEHKQQSAPPQEDKAAASPTEEKNKAAQDWKVRVLEANIHAIVRLSVSLNNCRFGGTGFIISANGYLLTNDHVIHDDESETYSNKVKMRIGKNNEEYDVTILFSDQEADVALCKFDPDKVKEFGVVKFVADYSQVRVGEDCLVVGNGFGLGLAPSYGIIRYTKDSLKGNLIYSGDPNHGDSGGPVFNAQGECIGIHKSKSMYYNNVPAEGIFNATPMDKINELLKQWCEANNIKL